MDEARRDAIYKMTLEQMDDETKRMDLERFTRDGLYADKNRERWRSKYPDCLVAVYYEKVVAVGRDEEEFLDSIEESGVPPGRAYIDFIYSQPTILML